MPWINACDESQPPIPIHLVETWDLTPPPCPWVNQRLYYKDKRTGEVKSGVVIKAGNFKFWFAFDSGHVRLDKDVIGKRLFRSEAEARNCGKTEADSAKQLLCHKERST